MDYRGLPYDYLALPGPGIAWSHAVRHKQKRCLKRYRAGETCAGRGSIWIQVANLKRVLNSLLRCHTVHCVSISDKCTHCEVFMKKTFHQIFDFYNSPFLPYKIIVFFFSYLICRFKARRSIRCRGRLRHRCHSWRPWNTRCEAPEALPPWQWTQHFQPHLQFFKKNGRWKFK